MVRVARAFAWIAGFSAIVSTSLLLNGAAQHRYLSQGEAQTKAALRLTVQALDGYLRRFMSVPGLLAEAVELRRLVETPADQKTITSMNEWLTARNSALDASGLYVLNVEGDVVAMSNPGGASSLAGSDALPQALVSAGLQGRAGRGLEMGSQPRYRSYVFSAPIRGASGEIGGFVAVKVDLDPIEAEWRVDENHILVTDPEGLVVLSTDPSWLYRAFRTLPDDEAERAQASNDGSLPLLPASSRLTGHGTQLVQMTGGDGVMREFIMARQLMPLTDWKVHVLLDTSYFRRQAELLLAAGLLVLGLAMSVAAAVVQRRKRLAERLRLQDEAKAELERRVESRTADLARVNAKLSEEITERRMTEQELRRTQADLVQAGKLAGLGQMSAALSHEINQPLAAARNFADSATVLIDRGEIERARGNINQIVALIDRMAAIARHLRNVARKPDAPLQDIDLAQAIAEAIATCGPRLEQIEVRVALPPEMPHVRGGPVRLQQVLANILSNAADAMQDQAAPLIEVTARIEPDRVMLDIRDTGPGVPEAISDRIFDPFFTTKQVGSGLGLGLSISFNIMKDFGGELRVAGHPSGGAVFTLVFLRSDAPGKSAK